MPPSPSDELPYVDLPDVAESFSDQLRVIHWDGQTARIEFAVSRPRVVGPNRAEMTVYPAARLVLTPAALVSLHERLSELVAKLEREGVLKRVLPGPSQRQ
jgi:hypothetical protein